MMKIYLDSNVFISLIREEVSTNRSLFNEAINFFEKVAIQKDTLVLSELFFHETQKIAFSSKEDVLEKLGQFQITFEIVNDELDGIRELIKKGTHFPDCVHANTAIKNKCDCIVTFNTKDFDGIKDEIAIIEPKQY